MIYPSQAVHDGLPQACQYTLAQRYRRDLHLQVSPILVVMSLVQSEGVCEAFQRILWELLVDVAAHQH